jgi:uncharacterized integral membrane protein|tara:strand:+ start:160 stop:396 length:237 start_codon:yes stop_codon:yes gene_type:complete
MKYFLLLVFFFFTGYLLLFSSLNTNLVTLDLYFFKIQNISLGFSLIGSLLVGALISFILQIPLILKKNKKKVANEDQS